MIQDFEALCLSSAIIAATIFGSYMIPTRHYRVYDGVVYNFFFSVGAMIFSTASYCAPWPKDSFMFQGESEDDPFPYDLHPTGLLGGCLFSFSNLLAGYIVKHLGLCFGFVGLNVTANVWNYLLMRFGMFGLERRGTYLSDAGLVLSMIAVICFLGLKKDKRDSTTTIEQCHSSSYSNYDRLPSETGVNRDGDEELGSTCARTSPKNVRPVLPTISSDEEADHDVVVDDDSDDDDSDDDFAPTAGIFIGLPTPIRLFDDLVKESRPDRSDRHLRRQRSQSYDPKKHSSLLRTLLTKHERSPHTAMERVRSVSESRIRRAHVESIPHFVDNQQTTRASDSPQHNETNAPVGIGVRRGRTKKRSTRKGLVALILYGVINGTQLVPMAVWQQGRPKGSTSMPFFFSQMLGVAVFATAMMVLYVPYRWLMKKSPRYDRAFLLPAICCGAAWTIGVTFQFTAIALGGLIPQAPIINVLSVAINTIISVVVFREAPGVRNKAIVLVSLSLILGGIFLLSDA